jgi:hypothetical protein
MWLHCVKGNRGVWFIPVRRYAQDAQKLCAPARCGNASAAALELDLLQVGVRWETSRPVARVDELFIDDDVELARLARPNVHRPAPASFNPSLHTEGFGFVASDGAVMYEDSHDHCLVGGNLAKPHAGSLPAAYGKCQFRCPPTIKLAQKAGGYRFHANRLGSALYSSTRFIASRIACGTT